MLSELFVVAAVDGYTSPLKIIIMLLLITPWLYVAPWVQKDAHHVRAPEPLWSALLLGAGAAGVLLWLIIPMYLLGLAIYIVLTGAALGAYVVYRNSRVPQEHRILTAAHIASGLRRNPASQIEIISRVKLYDSNARTVLAPDNKTAGINERTTYNAAQELLQDIIWRRASEADLSPVGQHARVKLIIDGVAIDRPTMSHADSEAIIQYLKGIGGMDVNELRRPQKGQIFADYVGGRIDIELFTTGTTGGQRMQFRIIQEIIRTNLDELGMSEEVLNRVRQMNQAGSGLIIVSARPKNGATSTIYSMLRDQDAFIKQLVTLEATPAVDLENITQYAYERTERLGASLASALRRDPDIVMVDTCPDRETAEIIIQAAQSKTVLLGMKAPDSFTALAKWVKVCGDASAAVKPLLGVLCQMLLRKLCVSCRQDYRPDPQRLAKLNLSASQAEKLYRPPTGPLTDEKGRPIVCQSCQGSGYVGRTAAFELLEITDELRQLVADNASLSQIRAASRRNNMLYLQEQALRKVIDGVTSIQEVVRVLQQAKKA